MTAYFSKNEFGEYEIPVEKQRPIFLMGPPGIGKTAIMEQIAQELGVGLVSYSMTHHTRQSALGLPFIERKTYGGREYAVSEYTMSEIIASVYDMMEETKKDFFPGVDIRAEGAHVVAPPSIHTNGNSYEWILKSIDEIADANEDVYQFLQLE